MKDPYRYFRIEARELLDGLGQGILRLEKTEQLTPEVLEPLFRASHTLKGAAGVVQHGAIAALAHRLEELFSTRTSRDELPIDVMLRTLDAIASELDRLGDAPPELAAAAPALEPPVEAAPAPAPAPAPPNAEAIKAESVRVDLRDVDELLLGLADLTSRLAMTRESRTHIVEAETQARAIEHWLGESRNASSVDWDALGRLVERLRDAAGRAREVWSAIDDAERRATAALEDARRLRLLPAETILGEVVRAARDAATTAQVRIEVETRGGELRLDANVLANVRDVLLQLMRNALAHAIEPEGERRRAGKPPDGRITIGFALHGARARISFRDDGRGIDVAGVRAALARQGASPEELAALDLDALMRRAMRSGVTTRSEASPLAGRGVGLQLVAHVVDRIRGELRVETTPGVGTEFLLEVPLSITAVPALVVCVGGVEATIPLDAVTRTARIEPGAIASSPKGDTIDAAGEAIRFAPLGRVLRFAPGGSASAPQAVTTIVLDTGGARAAIGVDRILGVANEVVLPLPAPGSADPLVVGASLDGRGDPRLALDPRHLVDAVRALGGAPKASPRIKKKILVIDDSLTSRMLEQSILEAAGYEVSTATSGEDGLRIARQGGFALFVVDVEMPGMTGFEFVARTRAEPALAEIPAVLVTSRAAPEDRKKGLDSGARAYIVKGEFAQDEFLDAVRRLCG